MLNLATWNVNSLRVRLPQVVAWLEKNQPTLLALQETKVEDDKFPRAALEAAGYHVIFSGQKAYNGVAILSQLPPENVLTQLPHGDDPQKRLIAATYPITTPHGSETLFLVNAYVPNGERVDSEKYLYKLQWLEQLADFLKKSIAKGQHVALLGDFNIAPSDEDVYDPKQWEGKVLCSEPEREHFNQLLRMGLCDAFRQKPQAPCSFSWWDYRTFAFRRNHGLRIDHILITPMLANNLVSCYIDKDARAVNQPSDHAPVVATFMS